MVFLVLALGILVVLVGVMAANTARGMVEYFTLGNRFYYAA